MAYRIKTVSKPAVLDDAHLISGFERFWLKVEENRRAVLGGMLLVVAALIAVGAAVYYGHLQDEKALDLHRQAVRLYLDRPIGQPAKADENLKSAIVLYHQVIDQHPRSRSAPLAMYELGNALVQANDLGGAIEIYKKFLAAYQGNSSLVGLVRQRLAFAHLLNGDREQAAKQLQAVIELPTALNKDQALFELGKLEEAQSRPEGALARYQDLMKNYPASPFAAESEIRIKALGGKFKGLPAVTPPSSAAPAPGTEQPALPSAR